MSFPPHTSYKPSGYDWLGNIPSDWRIQKFRHLFRESSEKIESDVFGEMLSVSGYRGIERKEYDDENRRRKDEDLIGYRIVRRGQLVVNTMWLNYAGLGFSDLDGHVSPAYRAYWPRSEESSRYLHYLLRSEFYVKGYTRLLTGVRPNSLQMSRDNMMSFPVILPDRQEQLAIASFLDRETAKIDALIAEQQRLIELLQEKRQAVISHAVTKGLNPDAPMKDSGVEWLGEVPEHWEVSRLGWIAEQVNDINHEMPEAVHSGVPFLSAKDLDNDGTMNFENDIKQISEADFIRLSQKIKPERGDIIYSRIGTIGRAALVDTDERFLVSYSCCVIRVRRQNIHLRFLRDLLASDLILTESKARTRSMGQPDLGLGEIRKFPTPIPPIEEQKAIDHYLTRKIGELDAVCSKTAACLNLLQERRSALISAAVTGQIDVRGLATEEEEEA